MRKNIYKIAIGIVAIVGVFSFGGIANAEELCDNQTLGIDYSQPGTVSVYKNDGSCFVYGGSLGSVGQVDQILLPTDFSGTVHVYTKRNDFTTNCATITPYDETFNVTTGQNLLDVNVNLSSADADCGLHFTPAGGSIGRPTGYPGLPAWKLYTAASTDDTRIISFTPANGVTIATSTSLTVRTEFHISAQDWNDTTCYNWSLSYQRSPSVLEPIASTGSGVCVPVPNDGTFIVYATTTNSRIGTYRFTFKAQNDTTGLYGLFIGGADILVSSTTVFHVVTPTSQIDQSDEDISVDSILTIGESQATSSLVNLPQRAFSLTSIFESKFPINWIIISGRLFIDLLSATTSDDFGFEPVSMNFASSSLLYTYLPDYFDDHATSSLTFTFFSTSTLNQVASMTPIRTMRLIVSFALWLGLISLIWREGARIFNKQS